MRTAGLAAGLAAAMPVGIASAQSIEVRVPDHVIELGASYTVEVWANSDGAIEPGIGGIAGFNLNVSSINGEIELVEGGVGSINERLRFGGRVEAVADGSWDLRGGQVFHSPDLNPTFTTADPVFHFSFDVTPITLGESVIRTERGASIDFATAWWAFGQAGSLIESENGSASGVVTVVPTPGVALLLGLGFVAVRRRG
ncbi:MAG: hypothetical protein AAFP26_12245 [Planctomycetota bacterium]